MHFLVRILLLVFLWRVCQELFRRPFARLKTEVEEAWEDFTDELPYVIHDLIR